MVKKTSKDKVNDKIMEMMDKLGTNMEQIARPIYPPYNPPYATPVEPTVDSTKYNNIMGAVLDTLKVVEGFPVTDAILAIEVAKGLLSRYPSYPVYLPPRT